MNNLKERKNIILFCVVLVSFVLAMKSAQLQIFTKKYKEQAARTTLYKNVIYPSRGILYDRHGKSLVLNYPIYEIHATYNKVKPNLDTVEFCKLLDIDKATFENNLNKDWSSPQFNKSIPFVFLSKISPEQFAIFQEHLYKFPGFYPIQRY